MSAQKQTRYNKLRKPRSDFQRLSRRFMSGLLRSLFLFNKSSRAKQAGFVLPTTVLLLLVMTLTIGALTFRTASRTQSAFLEREQQVLENAAAPAADRAKAKLEWLFSARETRFPGTNTPSSNVLAALVLNVNAPGLGIAALPVDPYTLPDETRIDINNDGTVDNAWSFSFDANGNGSIENNEIIAYSILMDDAVDPLEIDGNPSTDPTATRDDDIKLEDTGATANTAKANALVTRNGPINTNNSLSTCGGARAPSEGWFPVNDAALEKNFQVTAFVNNGRELGRANSAYELQQVRISQLGNTWGAWFKYDMEIHPGPNFNWNGAIHTDGNLFITNNFRGHMISSHNSCLYSQPASAITMDEVDNDRDGVISINDANDTDFQGQLVAGAPSYANLSRRGNPLTHLFAGLNSRPTTSGNNAEIDRDRDSVTNANYQNMLDIALDPIPLFTRDIQQHRRTGTWTRDANWATRPMVTSQRVTNQDQPAPFLDDFYRADNRYGPRPNYEGYNWVTSTEEDSTITTTRGDIAYDKRLGDEIIDTDPRADSITNEISGTDGYWERQAINNGMRIIVGQRLELGNIFGWNFDANGGSTDPLYPPERTVSIANKQRQRVTLKDNLAAVQGMVVYHYNSSNGEYPLACIANTAHAGTIEAIRASRTFNTYPETGALRADFLSGNGTNGWEFAFPNAFDTEAEFANAVAATQPLGVALRNLAYFAGDPNGGSPTFTPRQNNTIHPFPYQAMWGDFSVLRRIFSERLDATIPVAATANTPSIPAWRPGLITASARYNALSPADKSSLHSAACTMGLLAYNLQTAEAEYQSLPANGSAGLNALGVQLSQLMDGNTSNGEIGTDPTTNLCSGSLGSAGCPPSPYDPSYYAQFTPEQWINALENDGALGANLPTVIARARLIGQMQQIERDRTLGFMPAGTNIGLPGSGLGYNPLAGTYTYIGPGGGVFAGRTYSVACDPTSFATIGGNSRRAQLGLAAAFCSIAQGPKNPSLYYLFPKQNHNQLGTGLYVQPNTEEYINQAYLTDVTSGVNRAVIYSVVGDADGFIPGLEDDADSGAAAISFTPRANDGSDWQLPTGNINSGTLNPNSLDIKIPNTNNVGLSLLDKVMYNGREEMAVRVLDVDLARLTQNQNGGDYWISDARDNSNGMLYGAREDALREDAIVRPATASTTWANCNSLNNILNTGACQMRARQTSTATDPPLTTRLDGSLVGISAKPVDFAPDPDRRPYGFRLNAALNGNNGDLSDTNSRTNGLTFVTDNAAYVKGEFNPHTTDGNNTLEEFTQTLYDGAVGFGNPFYDNRTTANLSNFASNGTDRWRVAEILADAVYLLSDNFVDGSVEEGFIRDLAEASPDFGNSLTSFHNQQRPVRDNDTSWGDDIHWLRADGSRGATGGDMSLPIWVGRNGQSMVNGPEVGNNNTVFDDAENGDFELPDQRDQDALINAATPERINATIISGIVPSRGRQGYGGLHNFPRFLEDWNGDNLFIQGAFLQLNFSTAGTGPFDADAWEPGDGVNNAERIGYYRPPSRRWGYDVGLQFVPAGPIASRFVVVGSPRSEQYRELPVDDPYVTTLRCSRLADGTRIFPDEQGCS